MSKVVKRLGRGLDSLVSKMAETEVVSLPPSKPSQISGPELPESHGFEHIPVDKLTPNKLQPRSTIKGDSLASLVESIRKTGILQPIVARVQDGRREIIAGERRWRAAKLAGLTHVPVIFREATDEQMLELALIENIQREDLNAMERAQAYRQYCDRFGLSAEQVADRVGEDRTTVSNYVRLLELPEAVQELVRSGRIGMGHARGLLGIADRTHQLEVAKLAAAHAWPVRYLEEVVRHARKSRAKSDESRMSPGRLRGAHIRDLERRFEEATKTRVSIREGKKKGTGRIVIEYFSLEDFDRVAEMLGVKME